MPSIHARTLAFEALGVTLRFPDDSCSGLRAADGMVVFALAADEVRVDRHGYCTVLWAPARRSPWSEELLEHCRLALSQGRAEGFLFPGAAPARLALRVVASGKKYWARWAALEARQAA